MSMKLLNFVMYPVYGIPEQIRRRIDINGGLGDLQTLSQVVDRFGDNALGTQEFSVAMGGVVNFDGTPQGFERPFVDVSGAGESGIRMPYGDSVTGVYNWIAVMVENPINNTRSTENRYIMSGYTSRAEPSMLGRMPDDMRLYINDIYCVQATYLMSGLGERQIDPGSFRVLESYVLCQTLADQLNGVTELDVSPIAVTKTAEMVRKIDADDGVMLVPNQRSPLGGNGDNAYYSSSFQASPQLMASQLSNPEGFVGTLAKGYMHAKVTKDDDLGSSMSFFTEAGSQVETFLRQKTIQRNLNSHNVIRGMQTALSQVDGVGSNALGHRGNFSLGNLRGAIMNPVELDSWVSQSITLARQRGFQSAMENTDTWVTSNGQSTRASLISYDIAMQLGPILSRHLVGAARFVYDNRCADLMTPAQLQVIETSIESINGGPLPRLMAVRLQKDLESLMLKASKHNRQAFRCTVTTRLGTVTRVEICMDGSMPEFFTYASFMSNRMHVGITNDANYVGTLGAGVKDIMVAIDDGYDCFTRRSNISTLNTTLSSVLGQAPALGATLGGGSSPLDDQPFSF